MAKKKINSRRKGQGAERKLVKLFADWWGAEFYRTPGSGAFATLGFTSKEISFAGDIVCKDDSFPFCVESKKVEGWSLEQLLTSDKTLIHKWWDQTLKETPEGKKPLLVFTKNHAPLYAMMESSDFEHLPTIRSYFEYGMGENGLVCIFPLEILFNSSKEKWL